MVLALLPTVPSTLNPLGARKVFGLTARAWMTLKSLAFNALNSPDKPYGDLEAGQSFHSAYGTVRMPALPFYGIRCDEDVRRQLVSWKNAPSTAQVVMEATLDMGSMD